MFLSEIRLRNFRNFKVAEVSLNKGLNVFLGENAQGKSNLLEAISLLVTGQSFRQIDKTEDLVSSLTDLDKARVLGTLFKRNADNESKYALELNVGQKSLSYSLNGKSVTRVALQRQFGVVQFSPESLSIVKQGPNERRKFLDELVCSLHPEAAQTLTDYQKIARSKKIILSRLSDKNKREKNDVILLKTLNEQFVPLASKVTNLRVRAAQEIQPYVQQILTHIVGAETVEISVEYVISGERIIDWSEKSVYDAISSRVAQLEVAEMSSGQLLVGPQKHDVRFVYNGRDARFFCSQGQQRAIALAFKVAQIEAQRLAFGDHPILVLDDVLSELDQYKQMNLVNLLNDLPGQIFMSTTNLEHLNFLDKSRLRTFVINNGELISGQDVLSV